MNKKYRISISEGAFILDATDFGIQDIDDYFDGGDKIEGWLLEVLSKLRDDTNSQQRSEGK